MKKRILAVVLAALMLVSILPLGIYAEDETTDTETTATEAESAVCPGEGKAHTLSNCNSYKKLYEYAGDCKNEKAAYVIYQCTECDTAFYMSGEVPEHDYKVTKEAVAPSCTETGSTAEYTCSICSDVKAAETVQASGHNYETTSREGNCVDGGKITKTCTVCGNVDDTTVLEGGHKYVTKSYSTKDNFVDADGSKFAGTLTNKDIIKKPTCSETGIARYTCKDCGETIDVTIAKIDADHEWEKKNAVASTCFVKGTPEYYECTNCHQLKDKDGAPLYMNPDDGKIYRNEDFNNEFTGSSDLAKHKNAEFTTVAKVTTKCTTNGTTGKYYVCPTCKEPFKASHKNAKYGTQDYGYWTQKAFEESMASYINRGDGHGYKTLENEDQKTIGYEFLDKEGVVYSIDEDGYLLDANGNKIREYVEFAKGHTMIPDSTKDRETSTCLYAAATYYYCSSCDAYEYVASGTVDKNYHVAKNGTKVETVAETCTEAGYTTYKCKICGKEFDVKGNAAKAFHLTSSNYDELLNSIDQKLTEGENTLTLVNYTAPTCVKEGEIKYTCSCCKETLVYTIDATGSHTWVRDSSKDVKPTCEEEGSEYKYCIGCGEEDVKHIDPKHTQPTESKDKKTTDATHFQGTITEYKCTVCGEQVSDEADDKLPHVEPSNTADYIAYVPATCTTDGYKVYLCRDSDCNAVVTETIETPNNGVHIEATTPTKVPATCKKVEYNKYVCEVCGETLREVPVEGSVLVTTKTYDKIGDAKKEHNKDLAKSKVSYNGCVDGYDYYKCKDCGEIIEVKNSDKTATHNWKEYTGSNVTCTTDGTVTYKVCLNCGKYEVNGTVYDPINDAEALKDALTPDDDLKAKDHSWGTAILESADDRDKCGTIGYCLHQCTKCGGYEISDYVDQKNHPADSVKEDTSSEATCTEAGAKIKFCTLCKQVVETVRIEALGHENAAGQTLTTSCTNADVTDRICVNCESSVSIEHADKAKYVTYSVAATCSSYAYTLSFCPVCGGDATKVEDENAGYSDNHSFGEWTETKAPTTTEKGEETRTCSECGKTETRDVDMLPVVEAPAMKATFSIYNADAPEEYKNDFTDSSLVAVDVKLSAAEETAGLWAVALNVKYDKEDVKFEKATSGSDLLYSNLQTNDVADKGYVRVYVNAAGNEDVTISEGEVIVTLYFRINNKNATTTDFSFSEIEITTFAGESVKCAADAASIKIMQLMDVTGDGKVNLNDILAVYKMIAELSEETYSVAADLNKDGKVNVIDFIELVEFFSEKNTYEHVYNFGWNDAANEETK